MKKIILGFVLVMLAGAAIAATAAIPPTGMQFVSPVTLGGSFAYNGGTQVSAVPANGGTVTCTGGGTPTVTNANVTANSVVLFGLKTVGGTPAQPFMSAVTAGTSFVVTCGGSDTSVYNYIILG